jgi:small-conductance mechanosensitive channel
MKVFKYKLFRNDIIKIFYFLCLFIIIIGVLNFLIPSVNAAQTLNSSVNLTSVTDTTITWDIYYKTDIRATGATLDGVEITGFNVKYNTTYTAKELEPNTSHVFCIWKDLINCESGTTTNIGDSQSQFWDFVIKWLVLFVVIFFIFIGIRIPIVAIIAFIFALLAWFNAILSHDFWFIFIFTCLLIATMISGYYSDKRNKE